MEEKSKNICPICEGDGALRVGGLFGTELGIITPCEHCERGVKEKRRMEAEAEKKWKWKQRKRRKGDIK